MTLLGPFSVTLNLQLKQKDYSHLILCCASLCLESRSDLSVHGQRMPGGVLVGEAAVGSASTLGEGAL